RLVSVAENDHVRAFANDEALDRVGRFARVHDVVKKKFSAVEFGQFGLAEVESNVVVAQHGRHRRDLFQLEDQPGQSDVAPVQDVVNTRKEFRDFRIEIPVGVGNDYDFHFCRWGEWGGGWQAADHHQYGLGGYDRHHPRKITR